MTGDRQAADLRTALADALNAPSLPPAARQEAESLLDRLGSPVHVAVLGLPGSGKTQVLNILAGQRLVRKGPHAPILELTFGPGDRTVVAPDGTDPRVLGGHALESRLAQRARQIRLETPAERLRLYSLVEVRLEGTNEEQAASIAWAAERADILIWCTTAFTPGERALWKAVPDRLKDHGFLVLSKVDELLRSGRLPVLMAALEPVVEEEFHSLLPVAGLQAVASLSTGGAFTASGGRALVDTIRNNVARGRQADCDSAWMFLQRYKPEPAAAAAKAAPAAPADAPGAPGAASVTPLFAPEPAPDDALKAADRTLLTAAGATLRKGAAALREYLDSDSEADYEAALVSCTTLADALFEQVSRLRPEEPAIADLLDDLADAVDMMVLFQLEGGEGAVADAVSLLLQLRREIDVRLAA